MLARAPFYARVLRPLPARPAGAQGWTARAKARIAAIVTGAVLLLGGAEVSPKLVVAAEPGTGNAIPAKPAELDAVTAVIEASLTQGVAPLTVMFDGLKSIAPKGKIVAYRWDFGDEGPQNPRTGTGWLAAHRFAQPGKYEVRLSVQDESGSAADVAVTITVEPWKGKAYHFSSSQGDDGRTPEQAQDPKTPWKTLDKLSAELARCAPGTHFLLQRGDTWQDICFILDIPKIAQDAKNPVLIGAYGAGAKPVLLHIPQAARFMEPPGGLILEDLHIRGDADDEGYALFIRANDIEHLTLRGLTIEGFGVGINLACTRSLKNRFFFLEDCLVRNCGIGWCTSGAGWKPSGTANHVLLRHNEFDHAAEDNKAQASIYFEGDAHLFEGNHIHHSAGAALVTINTAHTIVRGNDLHDNRTGLTTWPERPIGMNRLIGAAPLPGDAKDRVRKHLLIESNDMHHNGLGLSLESLEDVEVRGNLFRSQQKDGAAAWMGVRGLSFHHNTFFRNAGAAFSEKGKRSAAVAIADNVFFHDGKDGCLYERGGQEKDLSNMKWQDNLYCYDKMKFALLGGKAQTQEAFMAMMADPGAVFGDPRFVDAEKDDLRLKPDSPAAKRGYDAAALAQNLQDIPRHLPTPEVRRSTSSGPAVLSAWIEASLTQGVAPLTVMFDALKSTPGKGKIVAYRWDFGDEGPKNPRAGTGWLAAHRFVKPGKYDVQLRVEDAGGSVEQAAVTITVEEWKGKAYHFSSSTGDDSRTPEQAQDPKTPWKSLEKLASLPKCEPGTHYLLRRGDTWEVDRLKLPSIPQDAGNPVLIGAYGAGEKPVLQEKKEGTGAALLDHPPSCLTVQDLHLQGIGNDARHGTWGVFFLTNTKHVTLRGLTIENFICGVFGAPQVGKGSRYVFLEDCLVRNNTSMGWLGGCNDHTLIRHNEFDNNGMNAIFQHNIYFYGNAFLIEGNHIHHGSGMGINTHHTSDSIIRGNHLHDNGRRPGGGIGIGWDIQGNRLEHILVEDNDLNANLLGIYLIRVRDLTVRNNLLRNCKADAISCAGMEELHIVNNTFYHQGMIIGVSNTHEVNGKTLRGTTFLANNIFYHNDPKKPAAVLRFVQAVPKCVNNVYFASDAQKRNWTSAQDKVYTLDEWQAYVKEEGAVFTDPRFVDAEKGDFRLQPGSPAAGRGCKLSGMQAR